MKKLKLTEIEKQSKQDLLENNEMCKIAGGGTNPNPQCCCYSGYAFRRASKPNEPQQ